MIRDGEEIIAAIIGPSKCGKTTLASAGLVPRMWRVHGLRSLVFDPWLRKKKHAWPQSAWVTDDLEKFKRAVFGVSGFAVFWDESSDTLNKYAIADRRFFTRIRHEHKAFFLLAHDLTVMDPLMRGNLSDLYVFAQGPKRAALYAEEFNDAELAKLTTLQKREFMKKQPFAPAVRCLPSLADLAAGKFP